MRALGRVSPAQVVALSAVIGETHELERWLGGGLLRTATRPVPLRERVVFPDGSIKTLEPDGTVTDEAAAIQPEFHHGGSQDSKPYVIPLVRRLVNEGKKVILFRTQKAHTVGAATYLAQQLNLEPARDVLDTLPSTDLSSASRQLRQVLAGGVGFHNADLDRDERTALESGFRDPASPLKVLVATTTLAMGINTPAEAVVIVGLTHPGRPPMPYTVAEYKNMAGRAGRPGHTDAGEAFVVATADPTPHVAWNAYVQGSPEGIESQLLPRGGDAQTLTLQSVLALGGSVYHDQLIDLLENSFAMWQQREQGFTAGWDSNSLQADIAALVGGRLLDEEPDGRLTLTDLGRFASESGIEVRSVTQVASLLRFAPQQLTRADLVLLAQVTLELDQTYIRTHDKSRQEQQRWPAALVQLGVSQSLLRGLHVGGGRSVLRSKRAAACLMLMTLTPFAEIEQALLQHTPENSAAGPIRSVTSRTRDVISIVAQIAQFYGSTLPDESVTDDLALQLELGIPRESLTVAQEAGATLTRGDYLSLLSRGLTSWEAIHDFDADRLIELIGVPKSEILRELAAESMQNG